MQQAYPGAINRTKTSRHLRAHRPPRPTVGAWAATQVPPGTPTLVLASKRSWAVGHLLKDRVVEVEEFGQALRTVLGGGTIIDPKSSGS